MSIVRKVFTCLAAALISAAPALLPPGSTATAATARADDARRAEQTTYYLDCVAGNDSAAGTSPATAWRSLGKVNSLAFRPGDTLLLRKGTTCAGQFVPQGSGTAARPVSVGAYGTGDRPRIMASDARAAVYLHNTQGWEIRGLDISDPGQNVTDPRAGIYVELTDFGTGSHYVFTDNYVHDVAGCDCTNPGQPGGGIVFNATGSQMLTAFSGITVKDNTVRSVSGIGIGTSSLWARRPEYRSGPGTAYGPYTDLLIEDNRLTELGGDGINITNGQHAMVQNNTVEGYGLKATTDHAGVWAWNSDYTTMQYNTIGGGDAGKFGAFAFDVDGADTGDLYQYNFTHDNGGLMLVCSVEGLPSDRPTIRYNISQNDRDSSGGVIILACTKQTNIGIYGNTVYAPTAGTLWWNDSPDTPLVANNIFSGRPGGSAFKDTVSDFRANFYQNVATVPGSDSKAVTGDPKMKNPGSATGVKDADGYKLTFGSPALGKGTSLPEDAPHDFFGNKTPSFWPDMGAYQGFGEIAWQPHAR
ncbi:right-handed parallel beta-helix repeat-containing protein [Streptomyces gamaensis]|uniref:Right-handed parallel beta-helix repeat-containing protein n=1 Tax=Streptomyces gamaensis TaxID=1763542 RepID=A0ABW0Z9R8_9ACTN